MGYNEAPSYALLSGGVVPVSTGGTGRSTLTNHGVLVGAGTGAITQLSAGSAGQVLQSGGASADPSYSTPTYPSTSGSTGTILRSDGTNNVYTTATYPATTTINQILYSSAANVVGGITTANNGTLITGTTGVPSVLANGTTGQVLTATTGSPPSWGAAASGSMTLILTQTASASTTLSWTALGSYTNFILTGNNITIGTNGANLQLLYSTNGGSTYVTTGYVSAAFQGNGSGSAVAGGSSTTAMLLSSPGSLSTGSANGSAISINLYNLPNTSGAGANAFGTGVMNVGAANFIAMYGFFGNTSTAINALRVNMSSGTFSGTFSLYGISQ